VSSTIDRPAVDRPAVPRPVLTARNGVTAVFALNGLAVATWFSRVPAVREALGLGAGRLGLLLLAMSAGALVAMSTAGLFALGYGSGACDVAMNVEGAAVEKRLGRTIMPRFHAAWSLGSVAGAGIGAGAARLGVPVGWHLSTVAAVVLAGTLVGVRAFLPAPAEPTGPADPVARRRALLATWREPRTLLIGLFVLVMAFTEGSANDWLAVAFVDGYGVSEAVGAAVFGVFVVGMTLGRTVGTVAIDRWGRVRVLLGTIGLAFVGATLAVLAGSGPVAVVGVALWGIGASLGFPVGMSAAADDEDRAPARVSVVAMIGYTAFLAGPPLLGFLGDQLGILSALGLVPLLLLPILALVPVLRPPAR
jgi:predicted MFS family arabinose efflux permease